jgi:formylglycine-generating enzyme required for sulfatase activity
MDMKQHIIIGSVAVGIAFVLLLVGVVFTLNPLSATNVSPLRKVCAKMRLTIAMLLVVGIVVGCGKKDEPTPQEELAGIETTQPPQEELAGIETTQLPQEELAGIETTQLPQEELAGIETTQLPQEELAGIETTQPPPAIAPFTPEQAKQHQQAWADHLKVPVEFKNSIGMKMVLIPPGEFMMGSPDSDELAYGNEKPQHKVRITKPFEMAAHEVTVGQFKTFVAGAEYMTEAETASGQLTWTNPGFEQTDAHPVVCVSWNDAVAFCEWLSRKEGKTYQLPTEAEWEYACRSGSTTRWYSGDNETGVEEYAWCYGENRTLSGTKPVGQKLANGFGLFDMHGNAWEWCSDWFSEDYYNRSPVDAPEGPSSGEGRVFRGGSFNYPPGLVRSATRTGLQPVYRLYTLGFRPARTYP